MLNSPLPSVDFVRLGSLSIYEARFGALVLFVPALEIDDAASLSLAL